MNAYSEVQSSGTHWPEPRQRAPILEGLEKQMAEFAALDEAILSEVRKNYVLPADSSVLNFLTEHRTIPQILLDAAPQLKACFGADAVFNLRAPIDESGSRILYAAAMWQGKSQDVRDALAKFDRDWWTARAGQAAGYLTFTYELV